MCNLRTVPNSILHFSSNASSSSSFVLNMREFKLPIEIDLSFLRKSQEGVSIRSDGMNYF